MTPEAHKMVYNILWVCTYALSIISAIFLDLGLENTWYQFIYC